VLGLDGPPEAWADELARVAELGFTTLLVSAEDDDAVQWLGADTAPRLRELVS
jgi:hypothetical protein